MDYINFAISKLSLAEESYNDGKLDETICFLEKAIKNINITKDNVQREIEGKCFRKSVVKGMNAIYNK